MYKFKNPNVLLRNNCPQNWIWFSMPVVVVTTIPILCSYQIGGIIIHAQRCVRLNKLFCWQINNKYVMWSDYQFGNEQIIETHASHVYWRHCFALITNVAETKYNSNHKPPHLSKLAKCTQGSINLLAQQFVS